MLQGGHSGRPAESPGKGPFMTFFDPMPHSEYRRNGGFSLRLGPLVRVSRYVPRRPIFINNSVDFRFEAIGR